MLWALAHVDFDGNARYWDAAMERLIGGERPTTPTDAAHVLIALHRRDALGALGEQSLQALMTSAALAGPTRHRLVRRMIEASPVPLIEPALASTAQVWQSQASAPWRRLYADNRHTKWIADRAKRLKA